MEETKTISDFVRELVNLHRHQKVLLAKKYSISQEIADCHIGMSNLAYDHPDLCKEICNKTLELDGELYNIEISKNDHLSNPKVEIVHLSKLKIN